jgi:hypothetical protein
MQDGNVGNSYLLESTLRFLAKNSVWARIENVDRTTDLMQNQNPVPLSLSDSYFARVQAYTAGYDREFGRLPHVSTALGGQIMWYGVPSVLRTEYGGHPVGALVFLRLRAK